MKMFIIVMILMLLIAFSGCSENTGDDTSPDYQMPAELNGCKVKVLLPKDYDSPIFRDYLKPPLFALICNRPINNTILIQPNTNK
jgi:hypothetical protein